ncbi:Protein of unknown function [Pyronema omphalodes CBS 100304]|uniref:Uncharacterized protein n=1 Tax=Pyronema omphalodes (strain CBS 100304) TaxID=1076935 RepID=U4LRU6_PYROM|nr:Protein of unknown function [Pyronema omphalodes CBS 100304]
MAKLSRSVQLLAVFPFIAIMLHVHGELFVTHPQPLETIEATVIEDSTIGASAHPLHAPDGYLLKTPDSSSYSEDSPNSNHPFVTIPDSPITNPEVSALTPRDAHDYPPEESLDYPTFFDPFSIHLPPPVDTPPYPDPPKVSSGSIPNNNS